MPGSNGAGDSNADFAPTSVTGHAPFGVEREDSTMTSSVSSGMEHAKSKTNSRTSFRTDSAESKMSSRLSFCNNSEESTGDVSSGRSVHDVDRPLLPSDLDPRVQTAAAVKNRSSRLSFGIDRILGASKDDNDEDDNNNSNNKSCSDVDSDGGEDDEEAAGDDDEETSWHQDPRSPGPHHSEKKDFRDGHFFLPRFGLEHLHPAALLPHPGVIRVPTHRPQPVFPLWPPSYGLPWIDMRRDRFGCE